MPFEASSGGGRKRRSAKNQLNSSTPWMATFSETYDRRKSEQASERASKQTKPSNSRQCTMICHRPTTTNQSNETFEALSNFFKSARDGGRVHTDRDTRTHTHIYIRAGPLLSIQCQTRLRGGRSRLRYPFTSIISKNFQYLDADEFRDSFESKRVCWRSELILCGILLQN